MDALQGNRPISLRALTDFSKLDQPTRQHLKSVYACLSLSVLMAAVGSGVHLFTDILKGGGLLCGLASIALLLALAFTPNDGKNQAKRLGFLTGFSFFVGLGLGPLMEAVIHIDASIVPTAFFATTLIFVCFTLSALWAEQRTFLYLGGTLMSALTIMMFLSLANLFIGSTLVYQIHLYGGLFVFCGLVLYDTQLIVEKRRNGDRDYIWHSVDLFLDFVNIFRRLMIILAKKEKKRDN